MITDHKSCMFYNTSQTFCHRRDMVILDNKVTGPLIYFFDSEKPLGDEPIKYVCMYLGFHEFLQNARKFRKFACDIFFFFTVYIFPCLSFEQYQ